MNANTCLDLDSKHLRSFATRERLVASIAYTSVMNVRHLVCRTPSGRWTAVFVGVDAINPVIHGKTGFAVVG